MWDKMETPTIVYDLDTSGGLMQQIQALLAPPKSEDGEKRSRKPDKTARRSGRATNHDTCDSCREGGDLLCCDHCPAAFHLQCCNPPLSKEMLPPGDWMCHRCSVRRKKRELKKEQINGLLERQLFKQSPSPAADQDMLSVPLRLDPAVGPGLRVAVAQVRLLERRPVSRPNTPTSTASTDTPTPSEQNDMDDDMLDVEEETLCSDQESSTPRLKRPFDLLIAAAMERNPTQFQLPNELTCTTALPGSSKRRRRDEMMGKNLKRPQHELDHNGLVPLPVKVCYPCGRSCRLAPLIQCDYCPLLFHMDCLEPPLTAMPVGKWMCPNHIEHLVLQQRSLTLSSRCQLFDQFQDRMSQHAVKVDFLQRVHRLHPPVRRGGHAHLKKTLKVPDSIKSQYRCPPVMIPPAGIRYGELICTGVPEAPSSQPPPEAPSSQPPQPVTSNEEQQEWLRGVITLQCSIMRHLSARHKSSQWEADIKPPIPAEEGRAEWSSDKTDPGSQDAPALVSPGEMKFSSCPSNGPVDQQANGSPEALSPPASTVSPPASTVSPPASTVSPPASTVSLPASTVSLPASTVSPPASTQSPPASTLSLPASTVSLPASTVFLPASTLSPPASTVSLPASIVSPPASTLSPPASTQCPSPQPSTPALPNHLAVVKTEAQPRPCLGPASIRPEPRTPHPPDPLRAPAQTGSTKVGSDGKMGVDVPDHPSRAPQPPGPQALSLGELSSCLKAVIDGNGEIHMGNLDDKFIRLLAWQRLQQLFEPRASSPQSNRASSPQSNRASSPQSNRASSSQSNSISTSQSAQTLNQEQQAEALSKSVQARAVFYPLAGRGRAVNMCYRSLHLGTGADMDVCLTSYGHCNYVSGKHACIFYDENTKQYELLNYSEHGTMVDNVLYSCDFSDKSQTSLSSSLVAKVHNIIKRCRRREQQEASGEALGEALGEAPVINQAPGEAVPAAVMSQGPGEAPGQALCDCKRSSCSVVGAAGWEGTALLHHGSLIKMGCMQFLFSVTEFGCRPPKEERPGGLASLQHSLQHSLPTSLQHSLPTSLQHSLPTSLQHSLPTSPHHSLPTSLQHSLPTSLHHSLQPSPERGLCPAAQPLSWARVSP